MQIMQATRLVEKALLDIANSLDTPQSYVTQRNKAQ